MDTDLLIVGAGPVGCVIAERAATMAGWTSLIIDKRNHVAGNCFDRVDENGLLLHQYGPHYFRTNSDSLYSYLSKFTQWIPGNYIVKSMVRGQLYPFPINLTTLEQFFNQKFEASEAIKFLDKKRIPMEHPRNSEEFVLSRVGRELYEAFYLGYTQKQWNQHPRNLPPSVCGRIPIRTNRDDRYVDHKFQILPKHGYTKMFSNMIRHEKIKIQLNTDYKNIKSVIKPKVATIYCGPIDEYFNYRYGKLGWRSLRFEFKTYNQERIQPCVQINYPNEFAYTRTVEIKHITRQIHPKTVVTYEYPIDEGDPYYPMPLQSNEEIFKKYQIDAEKEKHIQSVYFVGRLANYRYINTDEAIEMALSTFDTIQKDHPNA